MDNQQDMSEHDSHAMASPPPPPPPASQDVPGEGLQFDQAEFESGHARPCSNCSRPIETAYYELNGSVICPSCRDSVSAAFTGGSGFVRFLKSVAFGGVVAILCSIAWFLIVKFTNSEWGIVSIFVGWAVGNSVRRGASYRGGFIYQILAVGLTYLAICGSYVPLILEGVQEAAAKEKQEIIKQFTEMTSNTLETQEEATLTEEELQGKVDEAEALEDEQLADAANDTSTSSVIMDNADEEDEEETSTIGFLIAWTIVGVVFLGLACTVPFQAGNVLGLLIIGFGLWVAWKANRKPQLTITGPYSLTNGSISTPPPVPNG